MSTSKNAYYASGLKAQLCALDIMGTVIYGEGKIAKITGEWKEAFMCVAERLKHHQDRITAELAEAEANNA